MSISILILVVLISALNLSTIVSNGQREVIAFRSESVQNVRNNLRNLVQTAYEVIAYHYEQSIMEDYTEDEVKVIQNEVIRIINTMRYDKGIGYFWINDTTKPFPKMVAHPISPELNGKIMDDPKYNTAGDKKQNLFIAFMDVAESEGEGYVPYMWPKPTEDGLTLDQPKESFVKYFKPWGWIIGSGVYIDDIQTKVNEKQARLGKEIIHFLQLSIIVTILASIIIILIISLIFNRITKTINILVGVSSNIAGGDLALNEDYRTLVNKQSNDEIGVLVKNFDHLIMNIRDSIGKTKDVSELNITEKNKLIHTSEESAKASVQIDNNIQNISAKAGDLLIKTEETNNDIINISDNMNALKSQIQEQVSMVEESSASIIEMTANLNNISEITSSKKKTADELLKTVDTGGVFINSMIGITKELIAKMADITEMTTLINKISGKTNLLSMNAAIEAAHAGEFGTGFAVVAYEIRKLAESSSSSSKQIKMLTKEMMEIAEKAAEAGDKTSTAFSRIEKEVLDVSNAFSEITSSTLELTEGANQIQQAIIQLNTITNEVSTKYTGIDSASSNLTQRSGEILTITEQIKKSIYEISSAISQISASVNEVRNISKILDEITIKLNTDLSKYILS